MPQILRGIGMMIAIVPITNLALGTLAPERLKNASGLFNLTRNLGGAVGLAGLNTVLNNRIDLHLARLHEAITWARQPVMETLQGLTARMPRLGCPQHGAQAAFHARAPAGRRDGFRRCLPAARRCCSRCLRRWRIVLRRPAPAAASAAGGH